MNKLDWHVNNGSWKFTFNFMSINHQVVICLSFNKNQAINPDFILQKKAVSCCVKNFSWLPAELQNRETLEKKIEFFSHHQKKYIYITMTTIVNVDCIYVE